MASALDKLREHTAALQAVVKAAQEVEGVLKRVQAELGPLVGNLREMRRETEKIGKQRDADAWRLVALMMLGGMLGGFSAGVVLLVWGR